MAGVMSVQAKALRFVATRPQELLFFKMCYDKEEKGGWEYMFTDRFKTLIGAVIVLVGIVAILFNQIILAHQVKQLRMEVESRPMPVVLVPTSTPTATPSAMPKFVPAVRSVVTPTAVKAK